MPDIQFKYPLLLYLIGLVPIIYVLRLKFTNRRLLISSTNLLGAGRQPIIYYFRFLPNLIRFFVIILVIIAAAKPYSTEHLTTKEYLGIDIMIAFDISGSMLADDFKPNRLEVAKSRAIEFVQKRKHDRIGIVVYSGEAFTLSPLTTDKAYLVGKIASLKTGIMNDGTAIGMGLATAINSLEGSNSKNKLIVLISDGANNSGFITPDMAAGIAKEKGIKIHTIGIGQSGLARVPENADGSGKIIEVEVFLDEISLKKIAHNTGGRYYFAESPASLESIYTEIDSLEKTPYKVENISVNIEYYTYFAILALALILIEIIFRLTIFRIAP